ncbi:hypothetical protein ACM0A0_24195 [Mycobacteroides abscessus subsp. abscessus]|uniref:hypothetical protein n=1 Tax=Mycobacteroides abscessus TaxID=36809 RepID=UPI0039EFAFF5
MSDLYPGPGSQERDFHGLPVTREWNGRLSTGRTWARRIAFGIIAVMALFGPLAFYRAYIHPPRIDVEAITQRTANVHAQIGEFAADCAELWLTYTNDDASALDGCINTKLAGAPAPRDTAPVAEAKARSVSVNYEGTRGEVDEYSATVTMIERQTLKSKPERKFYRMGLSVWKQQPRMLGWPLSRNGPGPGVDVKLDYRTTVNAGTALYELVAKFAQAYYTQTSGLQQYVVAGSGIWPVGGYGAGTLTSLQLTDQLPKNPAPGETIRAIAQIRVTTKQSVPQSQTIYLTLENNNGTWMIGGLDLTPALADATPTPVTVEKK